MRVIALCSREFAQHLDLLAGIYRLRRRVFKDRLDWNVQVSGDLELDIYDTLNPTYLIAMNGDAMVGSVRLLPTTGPTMLSHTFPALLGDQVAPRSERILESSRFCVDTELEARIAHGGLNRVTFMLFAAMIESLRVAAADSIVTVTDTRMERILRRANWPLERIAPPQRIGQTMALAGYLHDNNDALEAMYRQAGTKGPVLADSASLSAAA